MTAPTPDLPRWGNRSMPITKFLEVRTVFHDDSYEVWVKVAIGLVDTEPTVTWRYVKLPRTMVLGQAWATVLQQVETLPIVADQYATVAVGG